MPTGTPFTPATFSTTQVSPGVATQPRTLPYISPSEYRFAPTALSSSSLVKGSPQQGGDSLASLALILGRASSWVDILCFRGRQGNLQAGPTTESMWATIRPDGGFSLICNFKPVWELTGLAIGAMPSQMSNISSTAANDIYIEGKVIHVPAAWSTTPLPLYAYPADTRNRIYAVWTYISGFPSYALAPTGGTNEIAKGVTTLTIAPVTSGPNPTVPAVYAGTQLTIADGGNTENVFAAAAPNGLVVTLTAPTQYAHTVPQLPDFLRVHAVPEASEQALINLTSVIIKTQGSRAMVMPGSPGGLPSQLAMSQAGAIDQYRTALELLKPFETVFLHD